MGFIKLDSSPEERNKETIKEIIPIVEKHFPLSGNFYTLDLKNFTVKENNASMNEIKNTILKGGSIFNEVYADATLIKNQNKKVIDKKKKVLVMKIPAFTKKLSYIIDGNSFTIPNQQRLKPGAYLVERKNGEIVTIFNTKENKQFKLKLNPETGIFYFDIGSSNIPAVSILKAMGMSDAEGEQALGKELYKANVEKSSPDDLDKFLNKSYSLPKEISDKTPQEKIKYLFSKMKVDPDVTHRNFNVKTDIINVPLVLSTMKKVLSASKGEKVDLDQKNNIINKQILNGPKIMSENYDNLIKAEINKIKAKLSSSNVTKISDVLSHTNLTQPLKLFLSTAKISRLNEEYNPLQMHMANKFITPMGEGGVGSDLALTVDDKAIHNSHMGFIDPIVSPEGSNVGVVLAVTDNSYIDDKGNPAIKVLNLKTKKKEIVRLKDLWNKKVAYPTTVEKAKADGVGVREGNKDYTTHSLKGIDYMMIDTSDLHAPSTKMLPLIGNMDGNRAMMGQKHGQQSLSLLHREPPRVSTLVHGKDVAQEFAEKTNQVIKSPVSGIVTKITDDYIMVGKTKIETPKHIPLSRKTYFSYEPSVKIGDKVKQGQVVANSNYVKDGKLATGTHLRTAWLTMPGNRNDAIIISESAAEKLTSNHMYKEIIEIGKDDVMDLKKAKALFPATLSKFDLHKYDENGIIKQGAEVNGMEPLVIKLTKNTESPMTAMEKAMFKPYKIKIEKWNHSHHGKVVHVEKKGKTIRIFVEMKSKAGVGDKLSGRYGNKGIIGRILPDDEMPKNLNGEPIHVAFTSNGVISRTNPGQVIEAGYAKVAAKTGKSYVMPMYAKKDALNDMENEAKKHKVELNETLINPETGKPFPKKIFVGDMYTYKLFKDSESGMSATGTDKVNINEQPGKGGKTSASGISNMEVNSILSHGAKDYLREVRAIKGQKNDEWFDAFRKGAPTPPPAKNFAYEKFKAMLEQLNVDVTDNNTEFHVKPITPTQVIKKGPVEIKEAQTVNGIDGSPIKGGLFDTSTFGVLGNRYAHIKLSAPIVNPLYEYETAFLLGIPKNKLKEEMLKPNGMKEITDKLNKIDVNKKIKELKEESDKTNNSSLVDRNHKIIKFLSKIKANNQKLSEVTVMKNMLVIPPIYRPIIKDHSGKFGVSDLNIHYLEVIKLNNTLKEAQRKKASQENIDKLKIDLQDAVSALYGLKESTNPEIKKKKVKGILNILGGTKPKDSFAQTMLLRKNQFMSGRGVIRPDRGDLKLDEIELPEEMGLKMYEPHISREMSKMGYTPIQTKEMIENKDEKVMNVLHRLGKEIPVIYNRAPSLWKHNIIGAYPKFVPGHTISVPPMVERALAGDFDGDQIAVHVPVTRKGIQDVKEKMMASKQLFTEQGSLVNKDLLMMTDQDVIFGIYKASIPSKKKPVRVHSVRQIEEMIKKGELNYNDPVII